MDQELTEQFNENMRQLSEMMAQLNSTMAGTVKSMNDASVASKNAATSTKQSADSQTNSTSQVVTGNTKLQEAQKKSSDIMAESAKNFAAAGYLAGNALKSFGSALTNTEEGFKKYGGAVQGAGDAAFSLGKNFGIIGTVIGGVTKGLTMFASQALGMHDTMIKLNREVTSFTGVVPGTVEGFAKLAANAGYAGENMAKMARFIQGLGTNVVALGNTAGEGAVKFAKIADVGDDVKRVFGKLGYSQEQLTEMQAAYIRQQALSGQSLALNVKTEERLRRESLGYAENLIKLSSITGQNAEDAQKEREAVKSQIEEQIKVRQEELLAQKLEKEGRTEEARRIREDSAARSAIMENMTTMYGQEVGSMVGRVLRTGAFDEFSAGLATMGLSVDDIQGKMKSMGAELATTNDQEKRRKILNEGSFVVADKYNKGIDRFSTIIGDAAQFSKDLPGQFGVTSDALQRSNLAIGKEASERLASADKLINSEKNRNDRAEQQRLDQEAADRNFQRQWQTSMLALADQINPLITNATNLAAASLGKLNSLIDSELIPNLKLAALALTGLTALAGIVKVLASVSSALRPVLSWFGKPKPTSAKADLIGNADILSGKNLPRTPDMLTKGITEADEALSKTSTLGKTGKVLGNFGKIAGAAAVLGSIVTGVSEFSSARTAKEKGEAVGGAAGGAAGGWAGAAAGAAIGTAIAPGIGTAIGGVLGGFFGGSFGEGLGRTIGSHFESILDLSLSPLTAVFSPVIAAGVLIKDNWESLVSIGKSLIGITTDIIKIAFFPIYWAGKKLADGLDWVWKKSEPAMKPMIDLWDKLRKAVKSVVDWFSNSLSSLRRILHKFTLGLYGEDENSATEPQKGSSSNNQEPAQQPVIKTPEQEKQEQEIVDKNQASAKTVSESSTRTELSSKKTEESTKKFDNIVASFGKIVASDGQIVAAFGKIVIAFNDAVTKFSDNITTFGDVFSMQGGSGSTMGATTGGTDATKIQQAMTSLTKKGWTQAQAAGIVGNLVTESKLNTNAVGDNGKAYGIAQWHPDRQAKFKEVMGKDIRGSSLEEQLTFLDWELRHTEKKAGTALMGASTAAQAASIFDRKYERSSGAAIQERMANANAIASGNFSGETGIGTGDSNIIALGNALRSHGFRISENPAFGGVTPGVHKGRGHAEGRAIDINLVSGRDADDPVAGPRMDALAAQLANNPNLTVLWKTAGHYDHMHVETKRGVQAAKGGVFAGSRAGYPATLHGTEMVAPLNLDSVLMKLAKTSTGTPEGQELLGEVKKTAGSSTADVDKISLFNKEVASMITAKLDKMIDILDDGNNTRHKILQHSR